MTISICYREIMKHQVVNVTEFKAKCLALLDGIGEHGGTITITKRGRPLASVGPVRRSAWKSPEGAWAGKVTIADDALEADTSGLWEVLHQRKGARG
jgi:antitoxin (DNA-binding transcriptional repressor) of toxin-antitoxin stability system